MHVTEFTDEDGIDGPFEKAMARAMKEDQMSKKIPNTSKNPQPQWLGGGNPRAIEAQEAQGQRDLVASEQLPVDGTQGHEKLWASMGVKLLPLEPPGDFNAAPDLFRGAILPDGWKKEGTDHSMWSKLVDANGNERAAIFYKAAFYDRKAHIRASKRYHYTPDYDAPDTVTRWVVLDKLSEDPIHSVQFDVPDRETLCSEHYEKIRVIEKMHGLGGGCKAWLEEQFPDYQNPAAYWEDV